MKPRLKYLISVEQWGKKVFIIFYFILKFILKSAIFLKKQFVSFLCSQLGTN